MRQARRIDSRGPSGMIRRLISFLAKAFLCVTVAVAAAGLLAPSAAQAAIITTGNVEPGTDPNDWTLSTVAYIGRTADGTLTINGNDGMLSGSTYLGVASGTVGTMTIDGAYSAWASQGGLRAGGTGSRGILNVTNGGSAFIDGWVNLGYDGGSGTVNVTNGGAVYTSGPIYLGFGRNGGSGAIKITNGGSLTFTGEYGTAYLADQNIDEYGNGLHSGSTASVIVDGVGSKWIGSADVATYGTATLSVVNGGTFSGNITIGFQSTSNGTVIIDGAGSTAYAGGLNVGNNGHGTLFVTNGGKIDTFKTVIGVFKNPSALGTAYVNGPGSSLTAKILNVGDYMEGESFGTGRLSISNGASVTAENLMVNETSSRLTIDVGKGSSLTVGTGPTGNFDDGTGRYYAYGVLTNLGTIRLVAGASAASGTYTPISAGTWTGSGTYQALGGVWDAAAHTVTVNPAFSVSGPGGASAAFNLAGVQRVLITDTLTGQSAGASFQAGTGNVTLNAASLSPTALAALQSLLASGSTVLSAWDFSATGYTVSDGNPVYLSLLAGPDQGLSGLSIWHYDGSTWSAFTASDLAYDGTYVSFTVTGFSGYAVSGATPTPIPAGIWLLAPGIAGLGFLRRRSRRQAAYGAGRQAHKVGRA